MDAARKLLKEVMAERGWKESPLSKQLGKNPAYLNQYFERGTPKILPEDVRDALGALFGLSPDSFKSGRKVERAARPGVLLLGDRPPDGRVVQSGAILLPDGSTALFLQLAEGRDTVVQVDQDAVDQIRKNLSSIEHHLRRS